ncbi:hypothetical protein EWM64_g7064 [Hericium alpestre]|uniref:Uncharacterized protein n=1 Tax=Hericium alpestre TaxID=135208 RepID=A0A4Y9ZRU3_9AGAM|nr:hypothetical protein EWM64_g7064 [Hericium alpestre]
MLHGKMLAWEVKEDEAALTPGATCCCAAECRMLRASLGASHTLPTPFLTADDRTRIQRHLAILKALRRSPIPPPPPPSTGRRSLLGREMDAQAARVSPTTSRMSAVPCPELERNNLWDALVVWHDIRWAEICDENPYHSRETAVMSVKNMRRLVDKAHLILGAPHIDSAFIHILITWIHDPSSSATIDSLITVLEVFRTSFFERNGHSRKKQNTRRTSDSSPTRRSRLVQEGLQMYIGPDLMDDDEEPT